MTFPATWPENCPPPDAADASGEVFRIVNDDPPSVDDLKSYAELGLLPDASPCRRAAISVYQSRSQACHRLQMSPRLGRGVAAATLAPTHGRMKLTDERSGHIAWWAPEGLDRAQLFSGMKPCR